MSDLISRSELLERFSVSKDGHRIPERDCDNFEVTVSIRDVKTIIKEQPTAYSVENVVEKLEALKDGYDHGCLDNAYERGVEAGAKWIKKKAIEIVKQGDVSDDVCKWEYDKHFEFAKSKCGSIDTHRIEFKKLKYCPYCGKKIKIVCD